MSDNLDKVIQDILWDDEDDFPEVPDIFKEQLAIFENELKASKLSEKTIRKHCDNVDFYLHDFATGYMQITELNEGCRLLDHYLGDWYIEKCMWASKTDCKSQAASIKKFYKCMKDHGLVSKEDYQFLVNVIKENQERWLETIERYDDWLMEDDDGDFEWFVD